MKIEEKLSKVVASHGATLYDTEVVKEGEHTIFRVYITKPDGVNLDLCAEISNDISPILDIYPPVSGKYFLEVSSPGVERKLSTPKHFQNSIGERLKLRVKDIGKKRGILKSADDEKIEIETKEGLESFNYSEINSAKTYFDWANGR